MGRKIINAIAVVLILLSLMSMAKLLPFAITTYEGPISIIIGGIALVTFSEISRPRLLRKCKYTLDYSLFVDRTSQIGAILKKIPDGKNIINVFGITGIGVTRMLWFMADILNMRAPFSIRKKYCKNKSILFFSKYFSVYINISHIADSDALISLIFEKLFITDKNSTVEHNLTSLATHISKVTKIKQFVFLFDGVESREQLMLLEDFARDYFHIRQKDTFVFGTHKKFLSYQFVYDHVEIIEFKKEDLMILAKAHNVKLSEKEHLHLYEITDGIPMFAYILLKHHGENANLYNGNLYTHLNEVIVPSLSQLERTAMEKMAFFSLANFSISKSDVMSLSPEIDISLLDTLHYKGLIQYHADNKEITIPTAIAKTFLSDALTQNTVCAALYKFYKKRNDIYLAAMYLLLTDFDKNDETFLYDTLNTFIEKNDILSLKIALSPSLELGIKIKDKHPDLFLTYFYASVHMLLACGDYLYAKHLLDEIEVDGKLIKRYDDFLQDDDYKLYFLWVDTEHLLNSYSTAIDMVDILVEQCIKHSQLYRLPQLYWMKAHCLRHQWKFPDECLRYYKLCESESREKNTEYLIRSIHGQICIALISADKEFDFEQKFSQLDSIYINTPKKYMQYQYGTYKYKSIYARLIKKEREAFDYLERAFEGFLSIKKRNLYDIYFEFGELYRHSRNIEKSKESYEKCIEFALGNSDYNLQSLAELGLILISINGSRNTNMQQQISKLHEIKKYAEEKELSLNKTYASIIEEHIKKDVASELHLLLFNP